MMTRNRRYRRPSDQEVQVEYWCLIAGVKTCGGRSEVIDAVRLNPSLCGRAWAITKDAMRRGTVRDRAAYFVGVLIGLNKEARASKR